MKLRPLDPLGVVGALLLGAACLSPSLLPRTAFMVGAVAGVGAALGYGLGAAVGTAVRSATGRRWHPSRRGWALLGAGGLLAVAVMAIADYGWQRDLHRTAGMPLPSWEWFPVSLIVALATWALLVGGARLLRLGIRQLDRLLGRIVPTHRGRVLVWSGLGALVAVLVVSGLADRAGRAIADDLFARYDAGTNAGVAQPTSELVSGGPASPDQWEQLGRGGRSFVSAVPSRSELADFQATRGVAAQPARDPIRVFVGMLSGPDLPARAELAVAELERLGGFDRQVLLIANSAGSGIVDESGVRPLEFMYGGDTAVVSQQYSYLPSWLSFLVDGPASQEAGRALYQAVHERWLQLPQAQRPRLLVFGESLGADSGQAAFATPQDLVAGVGGALFAGSPAASPLHAQLTSERDPGSLMRLPVFDQGQPIRFAAAPADFATPPTPWQQPRIGYLQNATDPVVWWSPGLLWSRPDWLAEPRGYGVSPALHWLPLVTFLEVSGDMVNSTSVPYGFGHVYGPNEASAWAEIAPPPGWTDADTQALRAVS